MPTQSEVDVSSFPLELFMDLYDWRTWSLPKFPFLSSLSLSDPDSSLNSRGGSFHVKSLPLHFLGSDSGGNGLKVSEQGEFCSCPKFEVGRRENTYEDNDDVLGGVKCSAGKDFAWKNTGYYVISKKHKTKDVLQIETDYKSVLNEEFTTSVN